jgi:hypothetical protein
MRGGNYISLPQRMFSRYEKSAYLILYNIFMSTGLFPFLKREAAVSS